MFYLHTKGAQNAKSHTLPPPPPLTPPPTTHRHACSILKHTHTHYKIVAEYIIHHNTVHHFTEMQSLYSG